MAVWTAVSVDAQKSEEALMQWRQVTPLRMARNHYHKSSLIWIITPKRSSWPSNKNTVKLERMRLSMRKFPILMKEDLLNVEGKL